MRVLVFLFIIFVHLYSNLNAETYTLSFDCELKQKPVRASFLLADNNGVNVAFNAFFRALQLKANQPRWQFFVTGLKELPGLKTNKWLTIDLENTESLLIPLNKDDRFVVLSSNDKDVRKQVIELQDQEFRLKTKVQALDRDIKRAKSDLEIVASIDRIVELQGVSKQIENEILMIDADVSSRKKALQDLAREPAPRGFQQRLIQLTKQLAEIATMVQGTESEEELRKSKTEEELRHINEVIELTSFESVEDLERELSLLQARRFRLQSKLGFTEQELHDYQLW